MTAVPEIFEFPDTDWQHRVGDPDCDKGWCAGRYGGFPHPCEEDGCDGLVHANFAEESWDGYSLYERCDVHDNPPAATIPTDPEGRES